MDREEGEPGRFESGEITMFEAIMPESNDLGAKIHYHQILWWILAQVLPLLVAYYLIFPVSSVTCSGPDGIFQVATAILSALPVLLEVVLVRGFPRSGDFLYHAFTERVMGVPLTSVLLMHVGFSFLARWDLYKDLAFVKQLSECSSDPQVSEQRDDLKNYVIITFVALSFTWGLQALSQLFSLRSTDTFGPRRLGLLELPVVSDYARWCLEQKQSSVHLEAAKDKLLTLMDYKLKQSSTKFGSVLLRTATEDMVQAALNLILLHIL